MEQLRAIPVQAGPCAALGHHGSAGGRRGPEDDRGGVGRRVFADGKVDITTLVQRLPGLVNAVTASIDKAPTLARLDRSAFAAYEKNVAALRNINVTIKRYLDIDVTVAPEDVREIADAIREIQR